MKLTQESTVSDPSNLKVGVVGATGMVGQLFTQLLEERQFPIQNLKLFASERSAGQKVQCQNRSWVVEPLSENCFQGLDLVFFSSGEDISLEWAPLAVEQGAFAIDNSSAFRMSENHLLCVPEINGHELPNSKNPSLIANPNCSTIQLVMMLNALKKFSLTSIRVASYQAVSGAGVLGQQELLEQSQTQLTNSPTNHTPQCFQHPIAFNCIPQIGSFNGQGFSSEEMKIMQETRKILNLPHLYVSAFCVRVPVINAHSEAVWVSFEQELSQESLEEALQSAPGLKYISHNSKSTYPMQNQVSGQDDVFVGRLHQDLYDPKTWIMWVVGDNLRKGAALNGIQIAESIFYS